jgi:rhodanese-related sulfurtransferase
LGLIVNHFNPNGISLIYEKHEFKWAPDSLFNTEIVKPPEVDDSLANTNKESNELLHQENNDAKEIIKEGHHQVKINQEKLAEEPKEVKSLTEPQAVTLEQAYKLYDKGVKFIDARDEADFLAGHIRNSINIPFDDFDNHKQKLEQLSKEKPMVIYCAGTDCDLSPLLANMLFEQGYKQIYVFFGGWLDWQKAKYPYTKSSE